MRKKLQSLQTVNPATKLIHIKFDITKVSQVKYIDILLTVNRWRDLLHYEHTGVAFIELCPENLIEAIDTKNSGIFIANEGKLEQVHPKIYWEIKYKNHNV